MDKATKDKLSELGIVAGLRYWLTSAPDDRPLNLLDRINLFISRICMLLLALAVIITFYEIVMRYVFFSPTLWVNEATGWIGSVVFLVSGVYTMQRRGHIRITAFYDTLSPRARWYCEIFSVIVIIAYAVIFIVPSIPIAWETLIKFERLGTIWNPPVPATVKPLCLLVMLLIALQAISNLFVDSKDIMAGKIQDKPEIDDPI